MMGLIALAQVLLIFVILGAVSVYVLDTINGMSLGANATAFINKGFQMYSILGDFGKVIVVVAVVGILVSMLGVRLNPAG
jgi:ABC-type multidrug transport system permease subunit